MLPKPPAQRRLPAPRRQVGATPEGVERPRCLAEPGILEAAEASLAPEDRPVAPTQADSKWRFFWRVGPRPAHTAYAGEAGLRQQGRRLAPAAFSW